MNAIVSSQANATYQDMVSYLKSLDGPVYAPFIGQLQDSYKFYPALHEIALEDMIREPKVDERNHPVTRRLLEPVLKPKGEAYILTYWPLKDDELLAFLTEKYVLQADLKERFAPLRPVKTGRFVVNWPRYLYKFLPRNSLPAQK